MKLASTHKQQGVSLSGLIVVLIVLAMFAVLGMKVMPSILEYQSIKKAIASAKSSGTTALEIRSAFDKQAQIDDITAVNSKDLEVLKNGEEYEISFAYQKIIPLTGPASLLIDYAGSTARNAPAKQPAE